MNIRLCIVPALLLLHIAQFHAAEKKSLVLPILNNMIDLLELPPTPELLNDMKKYIFMLWSENFSIQQAALSHFRVQASPYLADRIPSFMHNNYHLHTILAPLVPKSKKDTACNFIGPITFSKRRSLFIINRPNSHPKCTLKNIHHNSTWCLEPLQHILKGLPGTVKAVAMHPYKLILISQQIPADTEKLPSLALHVLNINVDKKPEQVVAMQSYPIDCFYDNHPMMPTKIWITPDDTTISFYKNKKEPYKSSIGIADLHSISPFESFDIDGQKLVKDNPSYFPPGWQTHSVSVKYSVSHPRLLLIGFKADSALKHICPVIYNLTSKQPIYIGNVITTPCK